MHIEHYSDGSKALVVKPEEVEYLIIILSLVEPKNEAAEQAIQRNIDDLIRGDDMSPYRTVN